MQYLHKPTAVAPGDLLFNLRSAQQIVLSVGLADNGQTNLKPDEGLLNPFECTGAVSHWRLSFPRPLNQPQAAMLKSLTNIILRVRYSAKAGEPTFSQKVADLVTEAENTSLKNQSNGASDHE